MPGIADKIQDIAELDGADVYIAGAGGQAVDSAESFESLDGKLLLWALLAVIVLLLITYRSPVLWILPIFSVIVALGSSLGLIYFLAKYADLTVNGQSQAIVSILVIGAGTDYALLAGGAISRRAPSSRGPARGDGVRAAPRHSGHRGQRRHRDRRGCSA